MASVHEPCEGSRHFIENGCTIVSDLCHLNERVPNSHIIVMLAVSHDVRAKRTCEANPAGENRSFIFTVYVKSVPLYHVKLDYLVLYMGAKEFFEAPF